MSELNLEEKIILKNLANWTVGFSRKDSGFAGDISIPKNGTVRLSRGEVIMQSQYGNRLINGIDGRGSHATVYIDDKATRVELEFESEDGKRQQDILTEDKVKKMFELKTFSTFEKHMKENIVTRAEKYSLIKIVKKLKLNDFDKIRYIEEYTGFKL